MMGGEQLARQRLITSGAWGAIMTLAKGYNAP
jgi:hypothetical protein